LTKLADEKGVSVDTDHMNKAQASQKIDELKKSDGSDTAATSSQVSILFNIILESDLFIYPQQSDTSTNAAVAPPSEWSTGDEPATAKQKAYLAVLEKKAGEGVHDLQNLKKGEASEMIEEYRGKTGE
jgi:hypothetical protein